MSGNEWVAWAAGVFEGEGSLTVDRDGRPRFQMEMTDHDVLLRLQSVLGGHVNGPYVGRPYRGYNSAAPKPKYRWTLGRYEDVRRVALLLYPFLGERRQLRFDDADLGPSPSERE
jgi:hypothetical protein